MFPSKPSSHSVQVAAGNTYVKEPGSDLTAISATSSLPIMAWIEQTKKGSIKSGGPQYYLQDLNEHTHIVLARKQRCPVRLWTPYGVIDSGLVAVSSGVGKVGHDRVQSGGKVSSIADQIAHWYCLKRASIERIEFEDSLDRDAFVVRPSYVKFFGQKARKTLYPDSNPLTLIEGRRSPLFMKNLATQSDFSKDCFPWIRDQIGSMVVEHQRQQLNVDERDLLRASGALGMMGITLGMYRAKGIDCPDSRFRLCGYPEYPCPIEVEEKSSGFLATHHDAHRRQRVVLLCLTHDAAQVLQGYVDVIELRELDRLLKEVA